MTPQERAEKICGLTIGSDWKSVRPGILEAVAAQIEEAEREAYDQANKDFDWLQSAVGKVYCSLTDNKLSKWNTDPDLLIAEVEDIQNEFWEKEIEKARLEGWNAAKEKAKGIAGSYSSNDELLHEAFKIVAERIGKMEPGK